MGIFADQLWVISVIAITRPQHPPQHLHPHHQPIHQPAHLEPGHRNRTSRPPGTHPPSRRSPVSGMALAGTHAGFCSPPAAPTPGSPDRSDLRLEGPPTNRADRPKREALPASIVPYQTGASRIVSASASDKSNRTQSPDPSGRTPASEATCGRGSSRQAWPILLRTRQ